MGIRNNQSTQSLTEGLLHNCTAEETVAGTERSLHSTSGVLPVTVNHQTMKRQVTPSSLIFYPANDGFVSQRMLATEGVSTVRI